MTTFIAGVLIGAGVMLVVMSLCAVAAEADRREERMESVEKIPSASKTGEWNCDENAIYHCSECGCVTTWDYNYCPDCGAMMNESEE